MCPTHNRAWGSTICAARRWSTPTGRLRRHTAVIAAAGVIAAASVVNTAYTRQPLPAPLPPPPPPPRYTTVQRNLSDNMRRIGHIQCTPARQANTVECGAHGATTITISRSPTHHNPDRLLNQYIDRKKNPALGQLHRRPSRTPHTLVSAADPTIGHNAITGRYTRMYKTRTHHNIFFNEIRCQHIRSHQR